MLNENPIPCTPGYNLQVKDGIVMVCFRNPEIDRITKNIEHIQNTVRLQISHGLCQAHLNEELDKLKEKNS